MQPPRPGFMDRVREVLDSADRMPTPDQVAAALSYLAMVASLPARPDPQPELPLTVELRAA